MKKLCLALLALLSLQLTGCVTYSKNDVADAQSWPLQQQEKKSVHLKVEGISLAKGQPSQLGVNLANLQKMLVKEYEDSKAFSSVTLKQQAADLYIKTTLTNNDRSSAVLGFISGFTLCIIPAYGENDFTLETRFLDAQGNEVAKIVKRETTGTWIQIALVLAMPFSDSADNMIKKMVRSTLEEAQQRKLI